MVKHTPAERAILSAKDLRQMHSGVSPRNFPQKSGVQRTPTYTTGKIGGTSSKTLKGATTQRSSFLQHLFVV